MGTVKFWNAARKSEKGQGLVEFALVVPMLLLLVFGIAELGRAWMTRNIMTGAAREAVRIAAVPPPQGSYDAAMTRANQVLDNAGITTASVAIDMGTAYSPVTATVTYNFPVVIVGFIPGLNSSTIELRSTTTMRREY